MLFFFFFLLEFTFDYSGAAPSFALLKIKNLTLRERMK